MWYREARSNIFKISTYISLNINTYFGSNFECYLILQISSTKKLFFFQKHTSTEKKTTEEMYCIGNAIETKLLLWNIYEISVDTS